jgi:hypothetical protein
MNKIDPEKDHKSQIKDGCNLYDNGDMRWYLNGVMHREDGPAIIWRNGTKFWKINGYNHRLDGPAVEFSNGHVAWFYMGERIYCNSQEEFEQLIRLKAFW